MSRYPSLVVAFGCALTWLCVLAAPRSQDDGQTVPHTAFEVPRHRGSWRVEQESPLSREEAGKIGARRNWRRLYRCEVTGQVVSATMIEGAPGPVAAHRPEVCYARAEVQPLGPARRWRFGGRHQAACWCQTLVPLRPERWATSLAYAWHDGKAWKAPTFPRWELAGHPTICRLQLAIRHPAGTSSAAAATLKRFLSEVVLGQPPAVGTPAETLARGVFSAQRAVR